MTKNRCVNSPERTADNIRAIIRKSQDTHADPEPSFEGWCRQTIGPGWGAAIHAFVTDDREGLIPLLRAVYNSGAIASPGKREA